MRYKKYYTWFSLHLTLQCLTGSRAYRQRWKLLQYITKVAQSQPGSRPSHFFLRDGFLSKDYNAPGTREKWSLFLTESELRVLRYLYWVRKKKSVFDCFEDEMSESEISEILERHIRLGSIVQLKTSLLSVVNDPGYWKDPTTGEKEEHSPVSWDLAANAEELALQRH